MGVLGYLDHCQSKDLGFYVLAGRVKSVVNSSLAIVDESVGDFNVADPCCCALASPSLQSFTAMPPQCLLRVVCEIAHVEDGHVGIEREFWVL